MITCCEKLLTSAFSRSQQKGKAGASLSPVSGVQPVTTPTPPISPTLPSGSLHRPLSICVIFFFSLANRLKTTGLGVPWVSVSVCPSPLPPKWLGDQIGSRPRSDAGDPRQRAVCQEQPGQASCRTSPGRAGRRSTSPGRTGPTLGSRRCF